MARRGADRRGDEAHHTIDRRSWLRALGIAGVAGIAGCSGRRGTSGTEGSPEGGEDTTGTDAATMGTATATEADPYGTQTETSTPGGELPSVGGTYRTVSSSPAQTLNPLYNTEAGAGTLIGYALDSGYGFKPGTEQFPQLYELTSDDSQVWVASLREGLEFSDPYGEVTAEDFVYQITEIQQSEWAGTADASSWTREEEPIPVEQTGTYEFQIELPSKDSLYPESYDPLLYPIPKDLVQPYVAEQDAEGMQQDTELLELRFTGNLGPYTLETWDRSNRVVYSRNDEYYLREADDVGPLFENAPYFESLESRVVQEQSSRLAALETGETDSAAIPPNRVGEFRNLDNVDVYVIPQPFNEVCVYNMRDNGWNTGPGNLFRRKKFRQGLGCAVDKQRLVEGVFRGFAQVEFTWQPRWSKWYPEDADIPQYGVGDLYGTEATRSRIREAISDTDYSYDGDRLVNPAGEQTSITLYHSAGQNTEKSMAQFIAQEFGENAGIEVQVEAIQGAQFARKYWAQQVPENPDQYEWSKGRYNAGPRSVTSANPWDMTVVFGLNTYPLNPNTASVFFQRDSFYNPYGYYPSWNASELFDRAQSATSEEELKEIFAEIFVNIAEDQPMAMLAFPSDTVGYASGIQGPAENFFSGWNFPTWHREG
ncbi:MAG: ABC transporter substrate-binding protein [Haloarculaceae archaeon]